MNFDYETAPAEVPHKKGILRFAPPRLQQIRPTYFSSWEENWSFPDSVSTHPEKEKPRSGKKRTTLTSNGSPTYLSSLLKGGSWRELRGGRKGGQRNMRNLTRIVTKDLKTQLKLPIHNKKSSWNSPFRNPAETPHSQPAGVTALQGVEKKRMTLAQPHALLNRSGHIFPVSHCRLRILFKTRGFPPSSLQEAFQQHPIQKPLFSTPLVNSFYSFHSIHSIRFHFHLTTLKMNGGQHCLAATANQVVQPTRIAVMQILAMSSVYVTSCFPWDDVIRFFLSHVFFFAP